MSTFAIVKQMLVQVADVTTPRVNRWPRTEFVRAQNQNWLVDLEAEEFGLDESERLPVNFDEAFA